MNYIERELERKLIPRLDNPKALFILGARQVGKTTLLKRLMEHLGTGRSLYFDLEEPASLSLFSSDLDRVLTRLRFDRLDPTERTYIFIDEIQYLNDFSKTVKILVDHHSDEFKLVMTGSSSLLIKQQFSESLAGRKEVLILHPLTFGEFCNFKNEGKIAQELGTELDPARNPLLSMTGKLEALMEEYIVYGGFPEVVLLEKPQLKIELLNEIVSSYLIKDIRHILQIEKLQEFNKLLRVLASSIAKEMNISELSRNVGLHRESVQKYLMALEESFIIGTITPFYSNLDKELRKMPKVYMADTGLRNMLINDFRALESRPDRGELVENGFYLSLVQARELTSKIHYWKTKQGNEIDFVLKSQDGITAFEVKYGSSSQNYFSTFRRAYPESNCFTVRYHYQQKPGELPLWYRIGPQCVRLPHGVKTLPGAQHN